jgi:hypothetical protein
MPPHKGSQETFEYIADWITPDFFLSKKDGWDRFGILAVLGDMILRCTPGDVAEIGTGESSIYLCHVARKYGRRSFHCDIAPDKIINPLTVEGYFTPGAVYLTPESTHILYTRCVLFAGASDFFFRDVKFTPLALGFIDGDHIYEQAKKDFDNMMRHIVPNGYVFLHDTYPPDDDHLSENRCGTVYRLRQEIDRDPRYDSITFPRGCAMGVGITLVRKKAEDGIFYHE